MYCICCKKDNVTPLDPRGVNEETKSEEDLVWKKEKLRDGTLSTVNNGMINNGIIHIIDAGYGSTHDGDQFIIAICDDCIKENVQDATLLYYGNYMGGYEDIIKDEVEKSKQKYRRRKNLDNLV